MSFIRQMGGKHGMRVLKSTGYHDKALQRAPHITSARLIGSEVESCFRIGNQRQKGPSGAAWHGLSVGTKATKALGWSATEEGAPRPAGFGESLPRDGAGNPLVEG